MITYSNDCIFSRKVNVFEIFEMDDRRASSSAQHKKQPKRNYIVLPQFINKEDRQNEFCNVNSAA